MVLDKKKLLLIMKLDGFTARSLISMICNDMEASDIGLLKKLRAQNLSDDMIARLFSDLLVAAVDTVS